MELPQAQLRAMGGNAAPGSTQLPSQQLPPMFQWFLQIPALWDRSQNEVKQNVIIDGVLSGASTQEKAASA